MIALTAVFYNIGFFTILAAGPFALPNAGIIQIGWIYFGWGLLLALVSVFVAPIVQRSIGTVPAILVTLALFALDLAVMAPFADHQVVVVVGIVLSGALIGNNNTLITEAVMGVAPVERPVASAAYSFVRFCGGAIGPYVALKLFGTPPDVHVHAPFWFGAAMVAIGLVILACGARLLTRTLAPHHETALDAGRGGPGRRPRLRTCRHGASRGGTTARSAAARLRARPRVLLTPQVVIRNAVGRRSPCSRAERSTQNSLPSGSAIVTQPDPSSRRWSATIDGAGGERRGHGLVAGRRLGLEVEVDPVLGRLALGHGDEEQPGAVEGVRRRHHDLGIVVVVDVPARDRRPERGEAPGRRRSRR